jgi:hypothetical protein
MASTQSSVSEPTLVVATALTSVGLAVYEPALAITRLSTPPDASTDPTVTVAAEVKDPPWRVSTWPCAYPMPLLFAIASVVDIAVDTEADTTSKTTLTRRSDCPLKFVERARELGELGRVEYSPV